MISREQYRSRIIEVLRLLASREEQLEYKRRVPIAHVSAELFCSWDEVFWPDDKNLRAAFSSEELDALMKFHSLFDRVCHLLPQQLPPIQEFMNSPHWLRLSRGAAQALQLFEPKK